MTDAYLMAQTLGFATGSALSAFLLLLVWRAERLAGNKHIGAVVAALLLLWNAGSLNRYVALLFGFKTVSLFANTFAYSALAFLPTALLFLLPLRLDSAWRQYAGRALRYVSFATATGLTLGLFAAAFGLSYALRFGALKQGTAYNFIGHLVVVLVLFRGAGQATRAARNLTKALLVLAAGLALGLLLVLLPGLSPTVMMVIETLTQQVTIPMTIIAFAFLSQFRFADVFVKRSLTLLAAVILAVIHATFIVAPVVRAARSSAPRAEAAAWLAATVLWCVLLLVFPLGVRALNRATDRWLFRRPDYRQLANAFTRQLETAADESALFDQAAQCIRSALDAAEVRVLTRAEWEALGAGIEPPDEVTTLSVGHAARNSLGEPQVTVLLPIRINVSVSHLLTIAPGELGRGLLSDELAFLATLAERLGRRIEALSFERERHEQKLREARWKQLLTETELKALRAQVNPHFLFNTLNTIADLISSEPEQAEAMTERLAEVFRYVLARTEGALISVREEFDFLRTYLEIEQARFGPRLEVEMTVDSQVAQLLIPPLLLQPLAENAIKHGLAPKPGGGRLRIRAMDEGACLRLLIEDDGLGWRQAIGLASSTSRRGAPGGIGLKNVTERLQVLYGARARLDICSTPGAGTQISISIPKDETQDFDQRRRSVSPVAAAETAQRAR